MPSSKEHKIKAEQNFVFLRTARAVAKDWASVVAFYTALHLVE